jgi:DNA polymerase elongation subunit (family B)
MINSLYGRFGMGEKDTYSIIVNYEDIDKYSDLEMISLKKINNKVMLTFEIDNKLKKELNIKNRKTKNNISIASSITSKSRLKLYKAQESVIANHGRVLYSDTDSIFASYSKNVLDEKHGEIL